jgi:hypothetical protein
MLTGFVSREQFDRLILECDAVLALTTEDGVQLSACNEAVGAGKPMILADTPLLTSLFKKGVVSVDARDAGCIAFGCRELVRHLEVLSDQAKEGRIERIKEWEATQATAVLDAVNVAAGSKGCNVQVSVAQ